MKTITRWKKPLLAGAILSTLVVAGWGAIVFTTLWLRARCLRELTDRAQPLPQAGLYDHLNPQWIGAAASMSATGGLSLVTYWSDTTESDPLDRLIELQRPSITAVWRNLFKRRNSASQSQYLTQTVAFSTTGQTAAFNTAGRTVVRFTDSSTIVSPTNNLNVSNTTFTISALVLANSMDSPQTCWAVDSRGDKILVVTRRIAESASGDSQTLEVTLIDSSGQVLNRSTIQSLQFPTIVGKLAEPHGLADQIIFATPGYVTTQDGAVHLKAVGPGSIRIIDQGCWSEVQTIDAP
jgi:hypothetical protein